MSKVIYHLTTEHIFYLIHNQCYLSLKADGYYKSEKIEEIDKICEFESVNDKKLIFNILNDKTNIQKKIFNLAKNLNIKYPDEFVASMQNLLNNNTLYKMSRLSYNYYYICLRRFLGGFVNKS